MMALCGFPRPGLGNLGLKLVFQRSRHGGGAVRVVYFARQFPYPFAGHRERLAQLVRRTPSQRGGLDRLKNNRLQM